MSTLSREPRADAPTVLIAHCGVDACLVRNEESNLLVVSPGQTLSSAVAAAGRVLPHLSEVEVRALLRPHWLGGDMRLDDVLPGYTHRWMVHAQVREDQHLRWVVAAVTLLLVALTLAVGYFTLGHIEDEAAPAPHTPAHTQALDTGWGCGGACRVPLG